MEAVWFPNRHIFRIGRFVILWGRGNDCGRIFGVKVRTISSHKRNNLPHCIPNSWFIVKNQLHTP